MKKIILISSLINLVMVILVIITFNFFVGKPKIMVADFNLLRETVIAKTITTLDKKDDPESVEKAIDHFEMVLLQMTKKKNVLIIDKNAVFGGDKKDITSELQNLISDL